MKVNESLTNLCLFHKGDLTPITLNLYGKTIVSNRTINALGVIFDSKLTWSTHVAHTIVKAKKALIALRLIKKNFNSGEMRTLLDACFYSILYYNAAIWLLPSLNSDLKQSLLSILANALRSCVRHDGFDISFENVHKTNKKVPQNKLCFTNKHCNCIKRSIKWIFHIALSM